MEYLTLANIVTAVIVLVMLFCLKQAFFGDIGSNRIGYILLLIVLGLALYLWHSGAAMEIIRGFTGKE